MIRSESKDHEVFHRASRFVQSDEITTNMSSLFSPGRVPHLRLAFAVVVLLSMTWFFLSSYSVSKGLSTLTTPASNSLDACKPCNCTKSEPESKPQSQKPPPPSSSLSTSKSPSPSPSPSSSSSSASSSSSPPSASASLQPPTQLELDVEQIAADFPMGYANPNPWFKTPGQPDKNGLLQLLTEAEKDLLPKLEAQAQHSPRQLKKIESFYGINRTGSWQDHINILDDNGLSPLTKWAQQYIHDHQNPASCEGKKFYVLKNHWPHHGLGAIVRRIFNELSNAILADRILILDDSNAPGNTLVDVNCARHRKKNASLECVVEDLSSCASFATPENSVWEIPTAEYRGGVRRDIPPLAVWALISYLQGMDLAPSGTLLRYWWRSQLYGFILRPNRAALERIAEMRLDKSLHRGVGTNRGNSSQPFNKTMPFPLPPSTISVHIRHGDKAGEGRLISTRDYIVAAERFVLRNPLRYLKRGFMSTEDPGAIEEAIHTPFINPMRSYPNLDWTWYWSNIPRVDGGPQANLELTHNKTDALITHIMQLWMAVECDT
ncbi:hypothetical protein Dda_4644 [Drechslerella dactyloides]|uniref:Uncharacterized protein n=1 Tax=Drechslerella dactyloides TaxID=74499 RepID=A0AAD6IXB3_DREDA|nr:hypothetical protein Dda_4644 [Drechslerella dactyloides]